MSNGATGHCAEVVDCYIVESLLQVREMTTGWLHYYAPAPHCTYQCN